MTDHANDSQPHVTPLMLALAAYRDGAYAAALGNLDAALAGQGGEAGQAWMLAANCRLKLGQTVEAADAFAAAAGALPEKQAEFLRFAARLYLNARRTDRLAAVAVAAARSNAADRALVLDIGRALLAAGFHPELEQILPLMDMEDDSAFAFAFSHYQLLRQPEKLKPLIEARYLADPGNGFIASHYFSFSRTILDFDAARSWQAIANHPDDPVHNQILMQEPPLSRCYWADDYAALTRARAKSATPVPRRPVSPAGERLKIAYLSSDLTIHATTYLLYDVFLAHDRSRFDITFLCSTPPRQALVQQGWDAVLKAEIRPVGGLAPQQLADEISRLGIDILVDLKGYTAGNQLAALSLSDAPVKATWIGFPGTVQGVGLDYHITDPIVTPDAAKAWFDEKLCRLPETYQGNCSATKPRPRAESRAAHGLPEEAFIFASFSSPAKISLDTMECWARILTGAPHSLIWLLCDGQLLQDNILAEFARLGIARERVLFAAGRAYGDHISRAALADMALDTFPYNGHTTTSDMLWAGLPMLTRRGQSFAARVSQSLLAAIGLPELVAENREDFIARAIAYAHDGAAVRELKRRLAENRAIKPLFDTQRFTRHLEQGYEMMAERARLGLAPDHIDVAALPARDKPFL
ncbi:O-linked N-acetylglucosamine transferase, SPINDLY family protein [Allorhizobium undicola]|uniref:O-linked N-acetylglucosamine transferase, SPINDLY family protein n=1 Tax=Allorhizobium undicola TaxID=78527 RepID=UPI0012B670C4|nr:hypothetical protein [Allorhizobium undicola]